MTEPTQQTQTIYRIPICYRSPSNVLGHAETDHLGAYDLASAVAWYTTAPPSLDLLRFLESYPARSVIKNVPAGGTERPRTAFVYLHRLVAWRILMYDRLQDHPPIITMFFKDATYIAKLIDGTKTLPDITPANGDFTDLRQENLLLPGKISISEYLRAIGHRKEQEHKQKELEASNARAAEELLAQGKDKTIESEENQKKEAHNEEGH